MRNPDKLGPDPDDPHSDSHQRSPYSRFFAWIGATLLLIVALACAGVMALMNTNWGHRHLLSFVERKASDALGVRVQLENLTPHLTTLSADLYGIRISGAAPYANPPLLEVDHLALGVRVVSLLHRSWYLDNVQIDHPVAWVVVDKNGTSNLPVFKSSGSSNTDLFQLGIRHFKITRGEVYYDSRPHAISADLHDLAFASTFSSLLKRYSGRLAYSNGNLAYGSLRPLEHNLEAEFDATPSTFTLRQGTVTAGPSHVTVNATIESYSNPAMNAKYQIVLDGKQAAQILHDPTMPTGVMQTSGTLEFHQLANRSAIQSLVINGSLGSERLTLNTPTARASVANLSARYALANGNASLENLRANVMGGELTAEGTMQAIGGNSHSSFHLNLQKVSLSALEQALGSSASVKSVSVSGAADVEATATWGKTIDDLIAHADLTLDGKAARRQAMSSGTTQASAQENLAAGQAIPIQGAFHAMYSNASRSLALNNSYLKSSQLNVVLNGTVSRQSSLAVNLQANDLSEIATLIDIFRTSGSGTAETDLKGQASFHGTIRGSTASPDLTGQLSAENLEYSGTKWKLLSTSVELNPSHAALQNLRLQAMDRGQVVGNVGVGLRDWSFTRDSALQLDLTASGVPTTTIAELAGRSIPVTGTINANAHLHGAAMAPNGSASVRLTDATAFGEPVSRARIDLTGSGNEVKASAAVQLSAGSIQAQVTTDPHARTYTAQLSSNGIDLAKLQAVEARGIGAKGDLQIHAHGQGTYDDPAVDADLEIPALTLNGQTISNTRLQVNEAHHIANVELASSIANATVNGKAQVSLQGDYAIDGSLDTPAISLQPFLAAYAPEEGPGLSGQIEVHASMHGPLKKLNQLQTHVSLPVLRLAYGNIQLAASPIQADLQNGTATLHPLTIRGTDTNVAVQGTFPLGHAASASLKMQGAVNLQIMKIFDPDLQASGQIKVNIDSHGSNLDRLIAGEIDIDDASLSTNTSPVGLRSANGVLKLTSDRFEITKFEGTLGGGEVTAQGSVQLRPAIQFNLGAAISGAKILYPQGVRETVNANLRLTGSAKHAALGGSVNLADMSFTPGFDLTTVVNQFSGGVEVPTEQGFEQNLHLNVAVNSSTGNSNLESRTLSVDGSANLQIRGTAAEPVILGRVNLTSGDVILNGDRFVLTGGTVQFINPTMTQPVLNVSLTTTIQEYKIDLRFRGPADQLQTQYSSDPSLPQADIINLLAFGQTTEASAMNATPMNQQAEGLVASQVASQVTSRISRAAGISQLSISPVLAGGTAAGPPGANLTIQQRVTGNLFVTFSTNVATTQGQTIQGQYQVSPRVTISATRDPNGGFAVDTLIKKSW
jgi:translocation and assembly module TamB